MQGKGVKHGDKKYSFSRKLAEYWQTGAMVDRVSHSEEDGSSQRVDKIKVSQGEEDQSRNTVVRVTAGVSNSGEPDLTSQQKGFKLEQMGRHNTSSRKKKPSLQGNKVKVQEGFDGFQQVDKEDGFSRQMVEDQTSVMADRASYCEEDSSSQRVDMIKVPSSREEDGSKQWPDNIKISQVDKDQTGDKVDRA